MLDLVFGREIRVCWRLDGKGGREDVADGTGYRAGLDGVDGDSLGRGSDRGMKSSGTGSRGRRDGIGEAQGESRELEISYMQTTCFLLA